MQSPQLKAAPLRDDVPDFVLDLIDRAAALGIPGVRSIILDAFDALVSGIAAGPIAEAIESGSAGSIFAVTAAWQDFEEKILEAFAEDGPLSAVMAAAAKSTLATLPAPSSVDLDIVGERSIAWLSRNGGRLVTRVTENTKDAITLAVQEAFLDGGLAEAARKILRIESFGLNAPQTRSLIKYGAELLDPEGAGAGLSAAKVRQLLERRYKKLRRERADLVARTESYNAGNAAQTELWQQAAADGELDPAVYVLEWVTRVIRVCPRCQALDGITAEITAPLFVSRVVESGSYQGQTIQVVAPTVHPRCYCTRRTIRREDALDALDLAA